MSTTPHLPRRLGTQSLKTGLAFIWVTIVWLSRWAVLLAIGIAWLAVLGFAVYGFRFYRGKTLIGFLVGCALVLFFLGIWFVSSVNKFYDWWREQQLKILLKDIDAKTETPATTEQQFENLLNEYESRVTLDFTESMKSQMASSPTFRATVTEATKLVLEAIVFQNNPHSDVEREAFQKAWQAKVQQFSERVAQEDPLAVEVILKAVEKESQRPPVK